MKDEIIKLLRKKNGSLSGEEICKIFNISRTAIWKHIQDLRKDGYEIDALTHKGYRLISSPDKLLPREIKNNLRSKIIGNSIVYFDFIDSTMNAAFRAGLNGEREGLVVCAEEQTKGKGRLGRKWSSPKGCGIYMSILLRPQFAMHDLPKLTLLSAVAVCDAVNEFTGITSSIKWPNDILVGEKKLAGILTEMNAEMDSVHFVVIGLGINVNTPLNVLPINSTSIKHESGSSISRVEMTANILNSLDQWYSKVKKEGFDSVMARWKELSSTIGRNVVVNDERGEVKGEAIGLDEFGRLIVKGKTGEIFKKVSGDVVQA